MFNQSQLAEFRSIATQILESKSWDELPLDKAWDGFYPIKPSLGEIESECQELLKKAQRIIESGEIECEYENQEEHIRMIYLENAVTFSLFKNSEAHNK